jgi:hypothetical protein
VEQSTRGFICWCADQLAETAGLAIEFATVLCAEVEDHKSRSEIVDELRSELMMELAIEAAPPTRHAPLSATKRAVADDVEVDLRFAAGDLAKAAFELADSRWPAQAASTAVYIAAKLLAAGGRIAANVVQLRVEFDGRKVSKAEWMRHVGEEAKTQAAANRCNSLIHLVSWT